MDPIRIGIVGMGKIARDQHLPAIRGDAAFSLAAQALARGIHVFLEKPLTLVADAFFRVRRDTVAPFND